MFELPALIFQGSSVVNLSILAVLVYASVIHTVGVRTDSRKFRFTIASRDCFFKTRTSRTSHLNSYKGIIFLDCKFIHNTELVDSAAANQDLH